HRVRACRCGRDANRCARSTAEPAGDIAGRESARAPGRAVEEDRLHRLPQALLQLLPIAATDGYGSAGGEVCTRVTGVEGFDFLEAIQVDDGAAVNARKALRFELVLDTGHGLAQRVEPFAHVQGDVVGGGFDPVDVFHLDEELPAELLHQES